MNIKQPLIKKIGYYFNKYPIYFAFLLIFILLSVFSDAFLTSRNLVNIFVAESSRGILAIGIALVLISKGFDLSVGANMAMSGIVTASLVQQTDYAARILPSNVHAPIFIAVLAGLLTGVIIGAINGYLIAYRKLPPFIATLGTMTALTGCALLYTNAYPVAMLPNQFKIMGQGKIGPVPIVILYFVVLAFIAWVILNKTSFGKKLYALGGSESAARVAGINIEKTKMIVYMWSGLVAAFSGIVLTARSGSGISTMGDGYQLDAVAACVVGGVSNTGGIGKISGVVLGVLLIGMINNGLLLLGTSPYVQQVVRGLVIVLAVLFDLRHLARRV